MVELHESWKSIYPLLYQEPLATLNNEILPNISFQPAKKDIFNVFKMPKNHIKITLISQDPYPTPCDAIGYAFATRKENKLPASLKVIQKELLNEYPDTKINEEWKTLQHWVNQGVFLLNTALTVESGNAGSHLKYWVDFTKHVIRTISNDNPCIWFLWGKFAQNCSGNIKNAIFVNSYKNIEEMPISPYENYVIANPHPAAEVYSGGKAGFYGCDCFKKANFILKRNFKQQIIF